MALHKKGKFYYGDSQGDIRDELSRYSRLNGYTASHFADAVCLCGGKLFHLAIDDNEGAAVRRCRNCRNEHPVGDSAEFLENAQPEECECPCKSEIFEITVGVALYENSEDVIWLYLGCRCENCGLTACYGDWKNEFTNFRELLKRV